MSLPLCYDDLRDTAVLGTKWLVTFATPKSHLASFHYSNNPSLIKLKMDWFALELKSTFALLALGFTPRLDWALAFS